MFKVGQKVVCVNNKGTSQLIEKNKYTIKSFVCDCYGVLLEEVSPSEGFDGFLISRFRPLDETFAESVLENIKEQIKEEQLILV